MKQKSPSKPVSLFFIAVTVYRHIFVRVAPFFFFLF